MKNWSHFETERKLLGPHYEGRLIPVETDLHHSISCGPLILIHGLWGSIHNFVELIPSVSKFNDYQIFYFAYDGLHRSLKRSALELSQVLSDMRTPRITILAHSAGALITREALNWLAKNRRPESCPEIHVVAVDAPWHGQGPTADENLNSLRLNSLRDLFLPAALADCQRSSEFFQSLYMQKWPEKFSATLFFAEDGDQAWDYCEGPLCQLPKKIADFINYGEDICDSLAEKYFWQALKSSSQYSYFEVSLHSLRKESPVTAKQVLEDLQVYFPRLPGNHNSVLAAHPDRRMDLPRYLEQIL